jgi:hypothetical protein
VLLRGKGTRDMAGRARLPVIMRLLEKRTGRNLELSGTLRYEGFGNVGDR